MSYTTYPFAVAVSGNQLVFTFTLPTIPASQLQLTNPWYFNINELSIKVDRFNGNLVHFGDDKGVITVNYLLSSSPSPAGGLASWIGLVLALLPSPTVLTNTNNVFTAVKTSAQTYVSGGNPTNILYNSVLTTSTDITYNILTGIATVNTTGDYQIDSYTTHQGPTTVALHGLRIPTGSASLVKYCATNQISSGTTSNGRFMITWPFTAGDTFAIAYLPIGVNITAYVAEANTFYLTIKRIPTILT